MDLFEVIKSGRAPMVTAMLAMSAFQQRIAAQFGIEPGAEMHAAIRESRERAMVLELIDREIGTTLRRVYHNVPWWRRFYLFTGLVSSVLVSEEVDEEEIEKLKEGDLLETTFAQFAETASEIGTQPGICLYIGAGDQELKTILMTCHVLFLMKTKHIP